MSRLCDVSDGYCLLITVKAWLHLPRAVHVGRVMIKLAMGETSKCFGFPLSVSVINYFIYFIIITIQPKGWFWQEPEPSQATGMALEHGREMAGQFCL